MNALESLAQTDDLLEHDLDSCGMCYHRYVMAQVAREMVAANESSLEQWDREVRRRWEASKYFKLWHEAKAAGRDPQAEFEARGWEP